MRGLATSNISWEVDSWQNGDAEQGVNISGVVGGLDVGQLAFTNGVILNDGQRVTGTAEIEWDPVNGASFTTTGLNTNAEFINVSTGAFQGDDDFTFIISARVGGANEDLFIDNLVVTTGAPGTATTMVFRIPMRSPTALTPMTTGPPGNPRPEPRTVPTGPSAIRMVMG